MSTSEPGAGRRIFLSFVHDDHAVAERIRDGLARSGIRTTEQAWEGSRGQDLAAQLRETIRASDVVVVLLSPAAGVSHWVAAEVETALSSDLERRGVEVVPVLIAPADVPRALRERAVVDLSEDFRAGMAELVAQIGATSRIDFSALTPEGFEDLVADLLRAIGFLVDDVRGRTDYGVDFRATYEGNDPFAREDVCEWLVEVKLYSRERVSVDAIHRLAAIVARRAAPIGGLLVTNAQLTSVASQFLSEVEQRERVHVRVIDGVELRRLLRQYPSVTERHFGTTGRSTRTDDAEP